MSLSYEDLLEENEMLKKTIVSMEITIESINDLRIENAEIRKELHIKEVDFQTFKDNK